ncbi:MAG: hypothetical protein ACE5K4_10550 [Candidatus Hydrothermarchaeota archaeon]
MRKALLFIIGLLIIPSLAGNGPPDLHVSIQGPEEITSGGTEIYALIIRNDALNGTAFNVVVNGKLSNSNLYFLSTSTSTIKGEIGEINPGEYKKYQFSIGSNIEPASNKTEMSFTIDYGWIKCTEEYCPIEPNVFESIEFSKVIKINTEEYTSEEKRIRETQSQLNKLKATLSLYEKQTKEWKEKKEKYEEEAKYWEKQAQIYKDKYFEKRKEFELLYEKVNEAKRNNGYIRLVFSILIGSIVIAAGLKNGLRRSNKRKKRLGLR